MSDGMALRTFLHLFFVLVALTTGSAVRAGDAGLGHLSEGTDPDVYGLNTNLLYVSAEEFVCNDECFLAVDSVGYWSPLGGGSLLLAPVNLPAGALVIAMRVFFYDTDEIGNISVEIERVWQWNTDRGVESLVGFSSSGEPGVTHPYVDISPDFTVAYRTRSIIVGHEYQSYRLRVTIPGTGPISFRGVVIYWQRQVSAAPGTATFNDVGTGHWAFQHIQALAASGVTAGCGGGSFCPDTKLSRAEMAVFLAKALGLHYGP